jgi:hypothetical protein
MLLEYHKTGEIVDRPDGGSKSDIAGIDRDDASSPILSASAMKRVQSSMIVFSPAQRLSVSPAKQQSFLKLLKRLCLMVEESIAVLNTVVVKAETSPTGNRTEELMLTTGRQVNALAQRLRSREANRRYADVLCCVLCAFAELLTRRVFSGLIAIASDTNLRYCSRLRARS